MNIVWAIFADPKILIPDEAASSVEQSIQAVLVKLMANRACLIIARCQEVADTEQEFSDAQEEAADLHLEVWILSGRENVGDIRGITTITDTIRGLSVVITLLFLLVAGVISFAAITRVIREQRILVGTAVAASKVYDGTTNATVSDKGTLEGVLDSDAGITIGSATAVCDSADVGTGKTVTATYTLSGIKADCYTVAETRLTADITAKDIAGATVQLGSTLTYTGQPQTQAVSSVMVDRLNVTTYEISGNTATDAGTYTLTIAFSDGTIGSLALNFTI